MVAAESLSIGSLYVSTLQLRAKSLLISARVATAAPRYTSQDHIDLLLQALTASVIATDLLLLSCILAVIQNIDPTFLKRAEPGRLFNTPIVVDIHVVFTYWLVHN